MNKINYDILIRRGSNFYSAKVPFGEDQFHGVIPDEIWVRKSFLETREFSEIIGPIWVCTPSDNKYIIYE